MKRSVLPLVGAFALTVGVSSQALATSATTFSSFEGEEEPTVRYAPASGTFTSDTYDNMTSPTSGTFRFYLRWSATVWDGDRNTTNADRQRAEVKGLGARQKPNETYEYSHTWKTDRAGSGSFWHVFQLKAVDGDNDAPLVTDSIKSASAAVVQYCSGATQGLTAARNYTFAVGAFTTTNVRVKVTNAGSATGELKASVNGDAMAGVSALEVYRPSATEYRPKWGSYRSVNTAAPYGNDTVEQKSITANKK
jgi:hypothetical protein